ncbi:MAG TPA: DUF2058 domain-containing protein [Chromatiaceae bacterium]|mgnify:CR=1 FL=1|jgi:uncharacterized protein YaiL (DUF2058 family)|nr:MAG: hypothetical protein N838_27710 [Thiohalocapsa sp. PB-PSB1]QQO55217.1 MAG: DUF2058 domain-containing protein [Thiohalocapsa sp. PB-PSB1]HBG96272.1 DUF2058 domain-containing protein [Chromatiaceae bacterium]HCS92836.1 DUF2058 domain-containing protein [Chromatiaceae bacterium]
MGNSLQDQLLKAGLVSQQQAKQTRSKKRKNKRASGGDDAASRQEAAKAAALKRKRDRELNRERDEEAKRKAELVALWQLIRDNRISRDGGDVAYNFSDGKALKRLYVNAEQHAGLVDGTLAIVRQDDFYALVSSQLVERIAAYDPSLILVHNTPGDDADDEYADFKVPDDLMW